MPVARAARRPVPAAREPLTWISTQPLTQDKLLQEILEEVPGSVRNC
jgi:hypothetical protein